jgi:hypothetical protein
VISLPGDACLGAGPTTARITVVDYNADLDEVFEPVRVLQSGAGFKVGGAAPERNLKFHQVNVWAIIRRTLAMLEDERLFGRRIPWAFEGGRLLVLPHAGYWENAFYDRSSAALHFFYFTGPDGSPVYTCLSHDIVTHELGHAVLDGLKPCYNEVSSAWTAGFHEYFGDAIAMTSALSLKEIVVEVVGSGPTLDGPNVIANIATQFGRALSPDQYGPLARDYLRTARNRVTMSDLRGVYEEHDLSEVLTGAYYDILVAANEKMIPMAQEARRKRKVDGQVRVAALLDAARLTGRLLLRGLDYCPPVDIDYLDYARAVIRSDEVAYPLDPKGFRRIAADTFVSRGIGKTRAELSTKTELRNSMFRNLDVDALSSSKTDAYDFLNANRGVLGIPPRANFEVLHAYRTRKLSADDYRPPREVILEFVWSEDVPLNGAEFGELRGASVPLWCGGTVVFSSTGNLLHYVLKPDTAERRLALLKYVAYLVKKRLISLADTERGLGSRARGDSVVSATNVNGRLTMQRSAALRHIRRKEVRDAE